MYPESFVFFFYFIFYFWVGDSIYEKEGYEQREEINDRNCITDGRRPTTAPMAAKSPPRKGRAPDADWPARWSYVAYHW